MTSPYDFRPVGPAFGSPLGGLSVPIDNVHHTASSGLKRARSFMLRVPQHPTVYVSDVNYQPTNPLAASPEGRRLPSHDAQVFHVIKQRTDGLRALAAHPPVTKSTETDGLLAPPAPKSTA